MAYMNGIDIASYQSNINLAAVPCDFVIVKATQGTSYINPDCARAVDQALRLGKAVGIYVYLSGTGAQQEIDFFFNNCKGWLGKVVWCIDWEEGQNRAWGNKGYLDQATKYLAQLTGKPPVIYASASVYPWDIAKANNCGAWVAQYANNNPSGYQETPWNEGRYSCAIRQYSSTGRLANWGGNLDLNKFYGDRAAWNKYIAGYSENGVPAPSQSAAKAKKTSEELAREVIAGQWGNGDDRKNRLAAAGYDYNAVQTAVNALAGHKSNQAIAAEVLAGKWGNGNDRKNRLKAAGYDYNAVQAIINAKSAAVKYTVRKGDSVSAIAQRYGVPMSHVSGFRSGNANVIYPGETLTIKK